MLRSDSQLPSINSYVLNPLPEGVKRKPLFIGCSGGAGHNAAIEAHIKYLLEQNIITKEDLDLDENGFEAPDFNTTSFSVEFGSKVSHAIPGISPTIRRVLSALSLPILPNKKELDDAIEIIKQSQFDNAGKKKKRLYLDMLIDIYKKPEYAAIWNILQRNDQVKELKKLIDLQAKSDANNYDTVFNYLIDLLEKAADEGRPYTEIISTQAMSLPAMCDAVEYYNKNIINKYPNACRIYIHQYMTDLPTKGAKHFFNSLMALTKKQAQQMILYAVNLKDKVIAHQLKTKEFAGLHNIDPKNNPIIRPGFRRKDLKLSKKALRNTLALRIQVAGKPDKEYTIKKNEQIASIMLGSQAATDTIEYVKELVKSGQFKKVFVFGGNSSHIKSKIEEINQTLAKDNKTLIVPLDNQDDIHGAPLLARSNVIIKRGGGMSIKEEMSNSHVKNQRIFIHCKKDKAGNLTSGISWEDGNVDDFIDYMKLIGITVKRTCVDMISKQLSQIRLAKKYSATRLHNKDNEKKKTSHNYPYTFFSDSDLESTSYSKINVKKSILKLH